MFEIPEAKRVRREDLYSPRTSPTPSTDDGDSAELAAQLAHYYGTPPPARLQRQPSPLAQCPPGEERDDEAEEFEFRLFRTVGGGAVKVVLERESEEIGDGAFVRARDPSWYFAGEGGRRAEFEEVAVCGEEVLRGARSRCWGLEVPWRVRVVQVGGERGRRCRGGRQMMEAGAADEAMGAVGKRKKAGKKRRISLRVRVKVDMQRDALRRQEEEERKAFDTEKEEKEREKKSKRNKEKQAKRRAKEKAEKAAKRGEAGDAMVFEE